MSRRHEARAAAHLSRPDHVPLPLRLQLIGEVLLTYLQARRLMAHRDLAATVAALRAPEAGDLSPEEATQLALRLARPVVRVLRPLPVDTRCLMRSLVLLRMMARRAVFCDLVIGARVGEQFRAHAWVEHAGQPVLPTYGYDRLATL